MKAFKQVERCLVERTYYVNAKNETEASSLIESGDGSVKTVDNTIDVQVEEECKEVT